MQISSKRKTRYIYIYELCQVSLHKNEEKPDAAINE